MERAVRCPPPGRGRAGIGPVGEGGAAHAMHVPGGFIARKGYYTTDYATSYTATLRTTYQAASSRTRTTRVSRCSWRSPTRTTLPVAAAQHGHELSRWQRPSSTPFAPPQGAPPGLRQLDTLRRRERDCAEENGATGCVPSCCLLVLERAASEGANSPAIDHARHRLLGARLARTSRRGTGDRAATTRRHRAALLRPCHARWHACDGGRARGLRGLVQPARWRSGPGGGGRAEPGYLWRPVVARRPRGCGQGVVLHVTVKAKNKALLVIKVLYK